jgi:deoxyribodipyrimidine photo-lyase
MSSASTSIVWFRNDLRLADNPCLSAAVDRADHIIPVFVWDPDAGGAFAPGAASRWWLHHALASLSDDLAERGLRLILRRGSTESELVNLVRETGAQHVFYNRRYEPWEAQLERAVNAALPGHGAETLRFDSTILHDVDSIKTTTGGPYRVFSPFWRRVKESLRVPDPLPSPNLGEKVVPAKWPSSLSLNDLGLLPGFDWAGGLREAWDVSERDAHQRLEWFVEEAILDYPGFRNRPDIDGTSALSPYLHHGQLSTAQVWHAAEARVSDVPTRNAVDVFQSELGWREFAHHLLHHYPHTIEQPLREAFAQFEWATDPESLRRWQKGRTGYPIVDAGMRQMWHTGWMHNRVRMIVASFLTKDLLIPWQQGAAWFWDTLVDSNLANNTLGWQWSAGSGADAQPFFRIFNPVTQGKKFDPDGTYVRRWLPELQNLPDRYLHEPWKAKGAALDAVGSGKPYPDPIVDHGSARERALDAYKRIS